MPVEKTVIEELNLTLMKVNSKGFLFKKSPKKRHMKMVTKVDALPLEHHISAKAAWVLPLSKTNGNILVSNCQ